MLSMHKMILGTVQLGIPYGINNSKGMPTVEESMTILDEAYKFGIRVLDTAEAYGDSQKVIGLFNAQNPTRKFEVITKYSSSKNHTGSILDNIEHDLKELSVTSLKGYMFHNYGDYLTNRNEFVHLLGLKQQGIIKKIGVSVYTNEEIDGVLEDNDVDFVQLPYNLLDNNNLRLSVLEKLKLQNKEVHVRSIFLQGLFYKEMESLTPKLRALKNDLIKINDIANEASCTVSALAIGYALRNKLIDHVLIGVDNRDQLKNNIGYINLSNAIHEDVFEKIDEIHVSHKELLNPINW